MGFWQVGGSPERDPRQARSAKPARRTVRPRRVVSPRSGLESILDLQAGVGNAAVARLLHPASVQRDPPTSAPTVDAEVQKVLGEQLQVIKDQIAANEEGDPAEAARQERTLLLAQFTHPDPFPNADAVLTFIAQCDANAEKESVTLAKLGKDSAQAMIQHPQAFPESWADQLAKTLDLGIDDASLASERARSWAHLQEVGNRVPAGVSEYGLPVSFAEIRALKKFVLKPEQTQLSEAGVVRDFAQAAMSYRGSGMRPEMVRWWKLVVANLVENVRSGTETIDPAQLAKITKTRGKFWEFVNSSMTPGEDQFRELDAEVANLQELEMLTAIISVVAGLHASGSLWTEATKLLEAKLAETDAIVAGWGVFETLKHAFLWMIDRGYVADQLLLMAHVLVDNIGDVLKEMALFMGLQLIPVIDVIVDAYLIAKMGEDFVSALWELGSAFKNASTAKSVIDLQQSSAQLVSALATAPLRMLLDYFGLSATLSHLESRVAKLLSENPAMTPGEAAKLAVREPEATADPTPGPTTDPVPEPSTGEPAGSSAKKSDMDGCFVAGTLVSTAAGLRSIEDVAVGDRVVATDPGSGRREVCSVTAVMTLPDRPVLRLRVGEDVIECTAEHPFWVVGQGWLAAGAIEAAMTLRGVDGTDLVVIEAVSTGRTAQVHNLTVGGVHTFHVAACGLLVHNKPVKARKIPAALAAARDALEKRLVAIRGRSTRISGQVKEVPLNRPNRAELLERSEKLHEHLETLQDEIHDTDTPAEVDGILRPETNKAEAALDNLQSEINATWVPAPTPAELAQIDHYTRTLGELRAALDSSDVAAQSMSRRTLDEIERLARTQQNVPKSNVARLQDHIESLTNQRSLMDTGGAYPLFGRVLPCDAVKATGGSLRGLTYGQIEARLGKPIRDLSGSAAVGEAGRVRLTWKFADKSEIHVDIPGPANESAWQISREAHVDITAAPPNQGIHLSQEGIAVPDRSAPAHMPIVPDGLLSSRVRGDMR